MWPYWIMFLPPAFAALHSELPETGFAKRRVRLEKKGFAWVIVWLSFTLLIGYRFEVGADFGNYFAYLYDAMGLELAEVLQQSDPAFRLLNWVSVQMDWGIFGVNLIGGAIFAFGLIVFCRHQPRPWLALAVSIPYIVIVVAMGYNRQGIALGLVMVALVALDKGSIFRFAVWMVLAAAFHKSAVIILPLGALASTQNRFLSVALIGLICAMVYYLMIAAEVDTLYQNYIAAEYQSEGALVRLLMNAVAAVILLIWYPRLQFVKSEGKLWRMVAIASLVLLGALMVSPSTSTAIDRMAVYLLPLQVVVFARLPHFFDNKAASAQFLTGYVLLYYGLVQFVWLSYAANAFSWIPYRFYPLEAWF